MCVYVCGGGCSVQEEGTDWPFSGSSQESLSFSRPLQALFPERSHPRNLGWGVHGGLGVYKYLQIFLVLVDIVQLEDVWVFNEL